MVSVSIHLSTRHRWENVRSDDEDVAQDHRSVNGNDDNCNGNFHHNMVSANQVVMVMIREAHIKKCPKIDPVMR